MIDLRCPVIVIVDVDTSTPVADIRAACLALTRQINEHWYPAWGNRAVVRAAVDGAPVAGEWQLQLRKVPLISGALGFHDREPDGTPVMYVFPELCVEDGDAWTSCASHEVLEALGDAFLNDCTQGPDGKMWAKEVCDQVEADTYVIDGVTLSNFNLPANFAPKVAGEKFDYLGKQTAALEVRPGGYAQWFDATTGWQQVGMMRAYRRELAKLGLSRGARRIAAHAARVAAA